MDSHPEQIALRPKEFFRTYDIEVLTEMQVRRIVFVPCGLTIVPADYSPGAGTQSLCLCFQLTDFHCRNAKSPSFPGLFCASKVRLPVVF